MTDTSLAFAPAVPGKTRLGWIGTGVMGTSMCSHLIRRGFAMTVFNRTRAKAEPLVALARAGRIVRSKLPKRRTSSFRSSVFRPTCGR